MDVSFKFTSFELAKWKQEDTPCQEGLKVRPNSSKYKTQLITPSTLLIFLNNDACFTEPLSIEIAYRAQRLINCKCDTHVLVLQEENWHSRRLRRNSPLPSPGGKSLKTAGEEGSGENRWLQSRKGSMNASRFGTREMFLEKREVTICECRQIVESLPRATSQNISLSPQETYIPTAHYAFRDFLLCK